MKLRAGRVDLEDREVERGIALDNACRVRLPVPELHPDRPRTGDDVLVRDDLAVRVEDEARALRLLRLLVGTERRRRRLRRRDEDLDNAAVRPLVDLARSEGVRGRR